MEVLAILVLALVVFEMMYRLPVQLSEAFDVLYVSSVGHSPTYIIFLLFPILDIGARAPVQ